MSRLDWRRSELFVERRARAVDPVCGRTIDVGRAVRREFDGQALYFCSESCARKFDRDPGAYDQPGR